jgi:pSer/pThr/pTyr-binding forkhead associated (FHA) protein
LVQELKVTGIDDMAAKLILSMEGVVLHEYALNKERMTIGRKAHNDVVIDNLAVSGEHAAIVTILNDSFLEDLDSTNGVVVNGAAIKKHFLQANDVIEIGKYKLKYINDQQGQQASAEDLEKTMVLRAPANKPQTAMPPSAAAEVSAMAPVRTPASSASAMPHEATGKFVAPTPQSTPVQPVPQPGASISPAVLQILSGPNVGKELDLVKNLTTLGKQGVQVAVLTRRPHGYFITHVEGGNYPTLNGKALNEKPHQLANHDIIELAGIKMEFYFKD